MKKSYILLYDIILHGLVIGGASIKNLTLVNIFNLLKKVLEKNMVFPIIRNCLL
jgi:hypothetical protein